MIRTKFVFRMMIWVIFLWSQMANAQEAINSSGSNGSGSGGSVSYTLGQMAYTTVSSVGGISAQGVQHALVINSLPIQGVLPGIYFKAFPNPTKESFVLEIIGGSAAKLKYQLTDLQGKESLRGEITSTQTTINTSCIPAATYLLHVIDPESKKIQSFEIIKN